MTIPVTDAQDAIHVNQASIPVTVLACGYDTGSPDIRWTGADYAAHARPYPAVHIDQDAGAAVPTSDVLDVESMAATIAEVPGWVRRARAAYAAGARPGQRWPAIYLSMGNLDAAVAALAAAGLVNVGFWTAQPGLGHAAAVTRVQSAAGHYPCIGVQYSFGTVTDFSVFSLDWVTSVLAPVTVIFPLLPGASGTAVSDLQKDLNRWAAAIGLTAPLTTEGVFGPLTLAAVRLAQAYLGQPATGAVSQALWSELQGPVLASGWAGMSATPYVTANFSWPAQGAVTAYSLETRSAAGTVTPHSVTGTHAGGVTLGPPGAYAWRVVPQGGAAASPWKAVSG